VAFSETVQIRGHLLDTGVLSRCVDDVRSLGGDYVIERFDVGKDHDDESYARIRVQTDDEQLLASILMRLNAHGVNLTDPGETVLREVSADGVFPADFYSTTNLDTQVRLDGRWVDVEQPEMDCGLLVSGAAGTRRVRTVPVSDVLAGDQIVCGASGVRVVLPVAEFTDDAHSFEFMNSEVSSEKPQALLVRQLAEEMRGVKASGKKVLWVAGQAVVHTGAAPAMVALVEAGFVDILFGGNAIATHDIESSIYGTSLGVDLSKGRGVEHGHEHHIRAINQIRAAGSIADAVDQGVLTSGVMHALVRGEKKFVLVGSVRDDGPLPDVITDVIVGQRKMREALDGVGFAIMVATMLHSVATGNLLPASIPLICVDINPATVTKLADRGSSQARGVVTDIGLFLEQLAGELSPGWNAPDA
jgi:lysine-ketoglutarate reductase/saccharopine dehydrogenase-like protein (TIGR00300 family)